MFSINRQRQQHTTDFHGAGLWIGKKFLQNLCSKMLFLVQLAPPSPTLECKCKFLNYPEAKAKITDSKKEIEQF